ncbi:hypothetical protein Tco_0348370 [Tanacetum coccineum]
MEYPSEDPYGGGCRQLLGSWQHVLQICTLIPWSMEDQVPSTIWSVSTLRNDRTAEDEAPTPLLPPSFLSPRIRPLSPRALTAEMRDVSSITSIISLQPSGHPLLPIPPPAPSASRRAEIPEADTPPRKRLLLTTPRPSREVGESSAAAAARQPGPTMAHGVDYVCTRESSEFCTRHHDAQKDRAAVRAEIEALEAGARVDTLEDTGSSS